MFKFTSISIIFLISVFSSVTYAAVSVRIDGYLIEATGAWQVQSIRDAGTEHMAIDFHIKGEPHKELTVKIFSYQRATIRNHPSMIAAKVKIGKAIGYVLKLKGNGLFIAVKGSRLSFLTEKFAYLSDFNVTKISP